MLDYRSVTIRFGEEKNEEIPPTQDMGFQGLRLEIPIIYIRSFLGDLKNE